MTKKEQRERRAKRVRARIEGTASVPRLSVFKSNKHISVQLIDDATGTTIVSASDLAMKKGMPMGERAVAVGLAIAEKAKAKKVTKIVFDRNGYRYTGKIKALADSARQGGLVF